MVAPAGKPESVIPAEAGIQARQVATEVPAGKPESVIPAEAGIQGCQAAMGVPAGKPESVIPAEAGIQGCQVATGVPAGKPESVIPAEAGIQGCQAAMGVPAGKPESVIPAEAGIQARQAAMVAPTRKPESVIPAEAGIQARQAAMGAPTRKPESVIPAEAGIQDRQAAMGSPTLKPLVVLVGPTAIGKSRIALEVARALGTEIVTADSTQVYRGMNIGTDTPPEADRRDVPHRVIDVVDPDEPFNAGEFRRHALPAIERLHTQGRLPLVVGGTGLYVRALLHGLWSAPPVDRALRRSLEAEARVRGDEAMYQELSRADPDTARRLHPRDAIKVRRALEVYRQTGVPLSQAHQQHRGLGHAPSFRALVLGLTMERAMLYQRIDQRVNDELEKGLVDETHALLARGYSRNLVSMKSLGYRQMAGYLEGDYAFDEAVQRLKRDTRRYAKRQMTWFRKEPGLRWVEIQSDETASSVARRLMPLIEHFVDAPPPSFLRTQESSGASVRCAETR